MGFLTIKGNSVYLNVDTTAKPIRPLIKEAISVWCRAIPSCDLVGPDGKPKTIRSFKMVDANFSQWMKNNPDPLWDKLDPFDKFKQDKTTRVDFTLKPIHILPVWSYADNDVKVVKQGNQFFAEMDKYYDAGGDVTACDWMCWYEGQSRRKKYNTSRKDTSPFTCPMDAAMFNTKIKAAMDQVIAELMPFKTEDDLIKHIHGETQAIGLPPQSISQTAMPSYSFGGQPVVPLGTMPMLPPAQPQQPVYQPPVQQPVYSLQQPAYIPQQFSTPNGSGMQQIVPPVAQPTWQPSVPTVPTTVNPQVTWRPGTIVAPQVTWQPPNTAGNPQAFGVYSSGLDPIQNLQPQVVPPPPPQAPVVPNAPVVSAPVFAPPQQDPAQQGITADTPLPFGKHSGKSLLWIKENDPQYLGYLKGNKKELAPLIESIMSQASAPPQQQRMEMDGASEELRSRLVKEINEKILTIPAFQGPGVMTSLMPFLQQQIGSTNFSDAPLDKLQSLKLAVDAKLNVGG